MRFTQVTFRLPPELVAQLKAAAEAQGRSVNAWVTTVLEALLNPDFAGDEAEQLRARLARAGLGLDVPRLQGSRPDPEAVAAAGARAASGTPLSRVVSRDR